MKLQNVVFGPNGTVRMNNKAEDHQPGDPLLLMVVPGGEKMGNLAVPDAESASELEETRKSIAKQKSEVSIDSPEIKTPAPAPVK
jgi:hypothetical protein